jgi:DNA-binding LytR/AlgR family response regulator
MDITPTSPLSTMVSLKTTKGIEFFSAQNIIYFFIENREVKTLLHDGQIVKVFHSLAELQTIVSMFHFHRCHAKCLINLTHVRCYNHKTSSVELSNNIIVKVAFDRKTEFKQLIYNIQLLPTTQQ